jgi:membrane associated rhomboid family serine protease
LPLIPPKDAITAAAAAMPMKFIRKFRKNRNGDDDPNVIVSDTAYDPERDNGGNKPYLGKYGSGAYGDEDEEGEEEEVYIVRQKYGYCSILFSAAQVVVLVLMMWRCGVAPLALNPMIGPWPDALSEWGGKNSVLIVEDGQAYRLVTPILLHAGVLHLLGNVAIQLETGVFFEREWGSVRWLVIYLASAIGASVLSVIIMPQAVSVGSSGAVMGLFGGKLAEVVLRACERHVTRQDRIAHQVRKEQCWAVTLSVVVVMAFSFIPFVDWAAHLGGLTAGFAVGIMFFSSQVEWYTCKLVWLCVGTALTIAGFTVALNYMYSHVDAPEELRDVCDYYKQNFADYECNCMRDEAK